MMMIGEQADRRRKQLLLFIHVCTGWVIIELDDNMLDLQEMLHGMEAVAMPRLSGGVAAMSGIIGQKEQDRLLERALLERGSGGWVGGDERGRVLRGRDPGGGHRRGGCTGENCQGWRVECW